MIPRTINIGGVEAMRKMNAERMSKTVNSCQPRTLNPVILTVPGVVYTCEG
jgi:hypothetical protein